MRFPKGSEVWVSKYFKSKEFDCPCFNPQCQETIIADELPVKLDAIRDDLKCELRVSHGGGYRCQAYEEQLRAEGYETALGTSQHELGSAADISTGQHSGLALEESARRAGFRAVGVAKGWAHVDLRSDKDRRWNYVKR